MGRGGTSQNTQRIKLSEGHSQTGDGIGKDKSGHGKNPTERGTLTFWRRHREVQVRTQKESHGARGHSHSGDSIGRGKSGHEKNPTEQGALTS